MRFTPGPESSSPQAVSPNRVNHAGVARSILRVPSLVGSNQREGVSPYKRQKMVHSSSPKDWPTRPTGSFTINYPRDGAWPQYYPSEASYHNQMHSYQPLQDPRFGYRSHPPPTIDRPGQYAARQIRSSRGRSALGNSTRNLAAFPDSSASSAPAPPSSTVRPNFPVSNRGKGPKKPAQRTASPDSSSEKSAAPAVDQHSHDDKTIEESARATGERVAMAISKKKTKRRFCLPLARNVVVNATATKEEEDVTDVSKA
jgi:hypothetical protein